MKYQVSKFKDFLRTPFPYLILALSIFMASTLLSNTGFANALTGKSSNAKAPDRYEVCLVCSGPGAKDAMSDIGFTAANFLLFPVTVASFWLIGLLTKFASLSASVIYSVYLVTTAIYAVLLPFAIFLAYEGFGTLFKGRAAVPSIYAE